MANMIELHHEPINRNSVKLNLLWLRVHHRAWALNINLPNCSLRKIDLLSLNLNSDGGRGSLYMFSLSLDDAEGKKHTVANHREAIYRPFS